MLALRRKTGYIFPYLARFPLNQQIFDFYNEAVDNRGVDYMKWFVRFGLMGLCLLLWVGLYFATFGIKETARESQAKISFSFPGLLPGKELYVWALSSVPNSTGSNMTTLLVQNITDHMLLEVEIIFLADGNRLCFEIDDLPPGEKKLVAEKYGAFSDGWQRITYISCSIK